jgi:hypothetical protein
MHDKENSRADAVERLHGARERRTRCSERYESVRGSSQELPAFTELQAAEEQFAAREAWLKWLDRDYLRP